MLDSRNLHEGWKYQFSQLGFWNGKKVWHWRNQGEGVADYVAMETNKPELIINI